MRTVKYLSPTSISKFYADREAFYFDYLCETKPERPPQTPPMSVGSAFDAFVKSYLHQKLYGRGADPMFDRVALFESQVEPQNRVFAEQAGAHLFVLYKQSGALADLIIDLERADGEVRFETTVQANIDGVPLLGKPDIYYVVDGVPIVIDWKVNGYCSQASPVQGYIGIVDGVTGVRKPAHKKAELYTHRGWTLNRIGLEQTEPSWCRQTTVYAWCEGAPIGGEILVGIDQVVCRNSAQSVRFAKHRSSVGTEYQKNLFQSIRHVWDCIQRDHVFDDLSVEESRAKCLRLEQRAANMPPMLFQASRG